MSTKSNKSVQATGQPQVGSGALLACARYHRKQVSIYTDVQMAKNLGEGWQRHAARNRSKHLRWAKMLESLANEAQDNDKLTP
jgi:hypothetical protein